MARKAKSSSKTTSTNPVIPSDNINLDSTARAPLASSQEASTPVQATAASNTTKKSNSKTRSTASPDAAALLARVAEQQAEIDRLRKTTQSMAQDTKPKEIKRPLGSITNLQKAMGLETDRALYMTCRSTISDALAHAGIPLSVDWRRQDFISLGKVASVAKARNKQLQLYESNWAALEIMKTIIKNKRSYRSKINRLDTDNRDNQEPPDQTQSSGSQQASASGACGASDISGRASDGDDEFSNSDGGNSDGGSKENGGAEGDGSGTGSAGTKRKATGSGGSGGKGKQRRV